jgi:hypothetical protein
MFIEEWTRTIHSNNNSHTLEEAKELVVPKEAWEEDIPSNTTITEEAGMLTEAEEDSEGEEGAIKEEAGTWDRADSHTPLKARTLVSSHPSKDTTPCNNHPSAVWE